MLTFAQFIRNLRTFVVKSALSRLRAFWEALLAKIWWGEAQKHFKGPGAQRTLGIEYFDLLNTAENCGMDLLKLLH